MDCKWCVSSSIAVGIETNYEWTETCMFCEIFFNKNHLFCSWKIRSSKAFYFSHILSQEAFALVCKFPLFLTFTLILYNNFHVTFMLDYRSMYFSTVKWGIHVCIVIIKINFQSFISTLKFMMSFLNGFVAHFFVL